MTNPRLTGLRMRRHLQGEVLTAAAPWIRARFDHNLLFVDVDEIRH
jgi:hypothetical protein